MNPFLLEDPPQGPTNPFMDTKVDTGGVNPFMDTAVPAPYSSPPSNDLPIDEFGLNTGKGRQRAEMLSMMTERDRLKAIKPADAGHKARLDRLIGAIDDQLAGKEPGSRSAVENFVRGTTAGAWEGLQFPVELAGNIGAVAGAPALRDYIEENRALINETVGARGTAGTAGEVFGNIAGSAVAAGGAAEGVGKAVVRFAPSTRIALAIKAAQEGSLAQRVTSNVITGLPITGFSAFGAPDQEVPEGASPEEAERIRSSNVASKIRNLAIGIGADALFGAIPHGRKGVEAPKEVPPEAPLTAERQGQLDRVKAQNAVKSAALKRTRLDKSQARSQWQILNPDTEWTEVSATKKRQIYDEYVANRRNSNVNTSPGAPPGAPVVDPTAGNPPEQQAQIVQLEQHVKALRGERDDARRLAETDSKLDIGNPRALERAAPAADKNSNLVYIFADVNGQKGINDALGYEAGDKLLTDSRDAMLAAHQDAGVKPRLFRYGGDELVAIVPRDKAQGILDHMETNSVKQYGNHTGSLSGSIHETLGDALSLEGKAKLASRKIEAKAKQGIPGRNAEEQAVIDAARQRINNAPPPPTPEAPRPDYDVSDPLPPDAMEAVRQVHQAGGLQDPESQKAFAEEVKNLYDKKLPPEQHGAELQTLIEDFTPLEVDGKPQTAVDPIEAKLQQLKADMAAGRTPEARTTGPADANDEAFLAHQQRVKDIQDALEEKKVIKYFSNYASDKAGVKRLRNSPEIIDALASRDPRTIAAAYNEKYGSEAYQNYFDDSHIISKIFSGYDYSHEVGGRLASLSGQELHPNHSEAFKKGYHDQEEELRPSSPHTAPETAPTPAVMYHGSPYSGVAEDFSNYKGKVVFLTENPRTAENYSQNSSFYGLNAPKDAVPGPNVSKVQVSTDKVFDLRKPEHKVIYDRMREEYNKTSIGKQAPMPPRERFGEDGSLPPGEIMEFLAPDLQKEGFDAAIAREPGRETSLAVFNKSTIKKLAAEARESSVGETPAAGTEGKVSPTPAPPPQKTQLQSIENKKALEDMSLKELGVVDNKLTDAIESVEKGSPEHAIIQKDFDAVRDEYRRRNTGGAPKIPETPEMASPIYGDPTAEIIKGAPREAAAPTVSPETARLRSMSPRKMTGEELNTYIADLEGIQRTETNTQRIMDLQKRMNKALEERAFRDKAANSDIPEIEKRFVQGSAGFAFGFATAPGEDKDQEGPDRLTNALMWTAIGLTGGLAVARMRAKARVVDVKVQPSDHWLGSKQAAEKIVNYADVEERPASWRERAREWYQGIVRRTQGIDTAVNTLTGAKNGAEALSANKNPAKLASMFGRWISMSEGALMDRPVLIDYAGNVQDLGVPAYREIADMVGGDLDGLGKLMAARASIEGRDIRKVPLDAVTSDLIFNAAPEAYHKAADAMRQFSLAMVKVLVNEGVISQEAVEKFGAEEFYAGLRKVFDPDSGPSKLVRDPKTKKILIQPNPVKGRKQGGNAGQVYNPAETVASMVPQIYRSAELNSIKGRLVDLWEAAGKPDHILKQVERRNNPISTDQQLRVDALKQEIEGLSEADAQSMVAAFDPKSLDPRSNVMTVYRDGVLRSYRVDENIAQSMASLTPDELEGVWKVLGMPANLAKKGVVLNPYFVAKQAFIDGWQATLNSQYGFRPGVDQFIGWMNIVRNTPEYRQFVSAGGGHSTLQSHDYANVKTALKAVARGGGGPLETAVKQLRDMKPIEAWKTMIVPFSESARVGEYLRARGHGASQLDALYAAKHVTANFQQRGGFTAMRGLDRASMFLNPAIQGLDQATFRAGINPFRVPAEGRKAAAAKYLSKAFVGITLPSMYFWMMNKDDKEINDLRKTPTGAKYWFMRSPVDNAKMGLQKGDIVKIPKPIVDGQIFGTSMEAYLDKAYGNDPAQMSAAVSSMAKDIGFNVLPTAGVLLYGLEFNKNIPMGGDLIPQGDEQLSTEHQGEDRASWVARSVSRQVAPLIGPNTPDLIKNATTPAGLDYITNSVGGMLGQDGLLAISQAVEAETKGYVPAKEELPIVQKVFAGYPTLNVAPIRRFYDRAQQVQTVGATINHLVGEDPTRLLPYMTSNQSDYILLGLFTKTRQDLANFRRGIQEVKDMPAGTISSEDRRNVIKQYQTLMIEIARQTNTFADEVDRAQKQKR